MQDLVRQLVQKRIRDLGLNMAEVSRRLDMNPTYIQQYLKKGHPVMLPERIRYALAEILKVSEEELRGNSAPLPTKKHVRSVSGSQSIDQRLHSANVDPSTGPDATPGASRLFFGGFDLPVFGTVHGAGSELIISQRAVDWVLRPSMLMRVEDAYAIIVSNDAMAPALTIGATALVNPHLPPRVGDMCVFRSIVEGSPEKLLIKQYRGETDTVWKTRCLNPDVNVVLKKGEFQTCHRIVGSYFP